MIRKSFAVLFLAAISVGCSATQPSPAAPASPETGREAPENPEYRNASVVFIDSDRYLFRSNRSGAYQLYVGRLSQPAAKPKPLTSFEKDVSFGFDGGMAVAPGGERLVLLHDDAYLEIDLSDGTSRAYAPPPADRSFLGAPRTVPGAADRFFFEVRLKSGGVYLCSQRIGDFESSPEIVWADPEGSGWIRDISPDARKALIMRFESHTRWSLEVADLESGALQRLYPSDSEREGRVTSARFSNDGSVVFVGTDGFREGKNLMMLDAGSGRELRAYRANPGEFLEVWHIAPSSEGSRVALGVTSGNRDRVIVLNTEDLRVAGVPQPDLPVGTGRVEGFVPGRNALVFEWATPRTYSDVHLFDLDGGTTALLRRERASVDRDLPMRVYEETIESFDGSPIPLNIYAPLMKQQRVPVVVYLHGGPNSVSRLTWSAMKEFFIKRGYAYVEPNIRGSSGFGNEFVAADDGRLRVDAFKDIERVGRWLSERDWVKADEMILSGASFGGYYVLMGLALQPELWAAGIDLYGISSWRTFFAGDNLPLLSVYAKEVGDIADDGAFLDSISPLNLAAQITAPLFIYHGKKDPQVPWTESAQMAESLEELGGTVDLMLAEEQGHGNPAASVQRELLARLEVFLSRLTEPQN